MLGILQVLHTNLHVFPIWSHSYTPQAMLTLADWLPPAHCVWPAGDPKEPGFRFCGARAEPGRPYCTRHERLSRWRPTQTRQEAA